MQNLAQIHGIYFVTNGFISAINKEDSQEIKHLMTHLCKLFVITQTQRLTQPIIEGGFVCPLKWSLLNTEK